MVIWVEKVDHASFSAYHHHVDDYTCSMSVVHGPNLDPGPGHHGIGRDRVRRVEVVFEEDLERANDVYKVEKGSGAS